MHVNTRVYFAHSFIEVGSILSINLKNVLLHESRWGIGSRSISQGSSMSLSGKNPRLNPNSFSDLKTPFYLAHL